MINEYYKWLLSLIDNGETAIKDYEMLLKNMFFKEYIWHDKSDYNREVDGLELRKRFESKTSKDCSDVFAHLNGSGSVLETIIALAERIDNEYLKDYKIGNQTQKWFWEMLDNLELTNLYNKNFDEHDFDEKMIRWMANTKISGTKKGPLQPFKPKKKVPRIGYLPLWDQMLEWVNDKIPFKIG